MTIQEINSLIEEARSLRQITQAFTQIASSKLKHIRAGVERNREFFRDLSNIYGLINIIAKRRKVQKNIKNGKVLTLLLTSNEKFYGKITGDLLEFYLIQVSKIHCDKVVIGRSGVESLNSMNYALTFSPFILKSDFPDNDELLKLSNLIKPYSKVLVFHPEFLSVLKQRPIIADISKTEEEVHAQTGRSEELIAQYNSYIVEPEIEIMVEFFDNQIKVLLLEAAFLESELARTASRLISMDSAQNEAEKYLAGRELDLLNAQRSIQNSRILETIAAMNKRSNG